MNCFNCNGELFFQDGEKVTRHDECQSCKVSLHVCKLCNFYDPSVYNECREDNAERILDKEKNNYCDYYVFSSLKVNEGEKENLTDIANSLFKD